MGEQERGLIPFPRPPPRRPLPGRAVKPHVKQPLESRIPFAWRMFLETHFGVEQLSPGVPLRLAFARRLMVVILSALEVSQRGGSATEVFTL